MGRIFYLVVPIPDEILPEELQDLGLSGYEAKTYITLLRVGMSSAKEISEVASIPFGRIYDVLSSLEDKQLIEIQQSRPKKFIPVDPKTILKTLINYKTDELDQIKNRAIVLEEKLNRVYNNKSEDGLFWSVAIDEEAIKKHNEKIGETEKELLMFVNMYNVVIADTPEILESLNMIQELIHDGVSVQMILSGIVDITDIQLKLAENFLSYMDLLRDIDVKVTNIVSYTFDIIDNEKVLLKIPNPLNSNEYVSLVYIWEKNFAKKMKEKFMKIWKTAENFDVIFKGIVDQV